MEPAAGGRAGAAASAGGAGPPAAGGSAGAGDAAATGSAQAGGGGTSGAATAAGAANGGQGGAAGAGGGPAAGAGGAIGSCLPSYLLCEDFEATAVGTTPTGWTAHGMATVAEDQANRSKHSLKVSPSNNGERRIYHDTALLGAQHWGRVYYRVQLPVPDPFVHSTLVAFMGKGPTVGDAEFRFVDTVKNAKNNGGKHQFLYNVQPQGAEFGTGTSYDWTFEDKWHCAEWHVDSSDQSFSFYFEGKQAISFSKGAGNYAGSELPSKFSQVRIGWNNYQSAPPGFSAWIDDFALAEQRIGCLP